MATHRRRVVGNWKMNGSAAALEAFAADAPPLPDTVAVALAVPATLIGLAAARLPGVAIGAQDVHDQDRGAHTGCLSAEMLAEAGAAFTIVGHSERRLALHESDALVRAKADAARRHGLSVILCVGETLAERERGDALARVAAQTIASLPAGGDASWLTIAYEPVWAIGSGRTPDTTDIAAMHRAIRHCLTDMLGETGRDIPLLYGGSVSPHTVTALADIPAVDGVLVGGASLDWRAFAPIIAGLSG